MNLLASQVVVFIDDDIGNMDLFEEKFRRLDLDVQPFDEVDSGMAFLENNDVAAVVLDIMMSPGKRYAHLDTRKGKRTGVHLYKELRSLRPDLPILVFTHSELAHLRHDIAESSRTELVNKLDLDGSDELPNRIRKLIGCPKWFDDYLERCKKLLELSPNWDSYDAERVDPAILDSATRIVRLFATNSNSAPEVVPTHLGGIQIEYHTNGRELELEFVSPVEICVDWKPDFKKESVPLVVLRKGKRMVLEGEPTYIYPEVTDKIVEIVNEIFS